MKEPEASSSLENEEEYTPSATVSSERKTVKPPCDQQQPGAVSELSSLPCLLEGPYESPGMA